MDGKKVWRLMMFDLLWLIPLYLLAGVLVMRAIYWINGENPDKDQPLAREVAVVLWPAVLFGNILWWAFSCLGKAV